VTDLLFVLDTGGLGHDLGGLGLDPSTAVTVCLYKYLGMP
jgi:hypothetical protein